MEGTPKQDRPVPGFPELVDVAVAWLPVPGEGAEHLMRHSAGSWEPVLSCGNPACRGGGFDLGSVVEGMLSFREAEKTGLLVCSGWEEGEVADSEAGIPCVRAIRYRIALVYSGAPATPPGAGGPPGGGP